MTTTDDELWAAFADSIAALDESAAIELDRNTEKESVARTKFDTDSKRLSDLLEKDDWEGIADEFGYRREDSTPDGSGSRAIPPAANEVAEKING